MSEILQPIENYQKKLKFITHLKCQKDLKINYPDPAKLGLYGVSGKHFNDYLEYYNKYNWITNRENLVLKEEKELCE